MMDRYGLLGHRLGHSISPLVHEHILNYVKQNGTYELYERDQSDIPSLLGEIRNGNIKGINITIPYKQTVFDMVDTVSSEAREIGAINTICMTDGELTGYNTDYVGFAKMLQCNDIVARHRDVIVLGNGGSCKAVCYSLDMLDAKSITIVSRKPITNTTKYNAISYDDLQSREYDVIVNTTPVGMYPNIDSSPLTERQVQRAQAVVDIIYRPKVTRLLQYANTNSIPSINGLYMLVAQAVQAQIIWNNLSLTNKDFNDIFDLVVGGYDFG